jgi:Pyruvate/2-oxoacid:ferredoxin oxidoreductase delta subunit
MPAIQREVEEAREEGVQIHEYRGIRRLILRGERIVGIEMVHMKKLMQPSGRLKRIAFEGTETVLYVDQVIPAVGQVLEPFGMESVANNSHFKVDAHGHVADHRGLFSGGDARKGSGGTVTAAVGDGRRAALGMIALINGQSLGEPQAPTALSYDQLNIHYYEPAPRVKELALPVAERSGDEEITGPLSGPSISNEAMRCFSCGNCLACDNCWTLCPDSAVLKTNELASDGSHYVFDYDYCKGCGLCAHECPCGYIEMEEDL